MPLRRVFAGAVRRGAPRGPAAPWRRSLTTDFSSHGYWEAFYAKKNPDAEPSPPPAPGPPPPAAVRPPQHPPAPRPGTFEWFIGGQTVLDALGPHLRTLEGAAPVHVLHVGCGTSLLGVQVAAAQGNLHVLNVDACARAVQAMQRHAHPRCRFAVCDMMATGLQAGAFEVCRCGQGVGSLCITLVCGAPVSLQRRVQ